LSFELQKDTFEEMSTGCIVLRFVASYYDVWTFLLAWIWKKS